MWAQWRAIGGSAGNAKPATAIVDPEALVIASLFGEDDELRLHDILYSWTEKNAPLLSVGRMRKLAPVDLPRFVDKFQQFAATAAKLAKHPRWVALTATHSDTAASIEEFRTARAVEPRLDTPAALMLRMRSAFGVGAKADALTYLLGQADRPLPDATTVRATARALGYTSVATRGALTDLTAAKFLVASTDRPVAFAAPHHGWHDLLNLPQLPAWRPWYYIYVFAWRLLGWLDEVGKRNVSDDIIRIQQQKMLDMNAPVRQLVAMYEASRVGYSRGPASALVSLLASPGFL